MCGVRSEAEDEAHQTDVIRRDDAAEDVAIAEYSAASFLGLASVAEIEAKSFNLATR